MSNPSTIIPYDPMFLGDGLRVPLPVLKGPALLSAYKSGKVFDYTYYSLVMNEVRRCAVFSAANVDGSRWVSLGRGSWWRNDPRIDSKVQFPDKFFSSTWNRGHLTRRADVCWGPREVADKANRNTFYLSNAAPQHTRFNSDEWGELEDWFLENAKSHLARATVLTGCIFREQDPVVLSDGVTHKIPAGFWKIIVIQDPNSLTPDLTASAFLMKQDDLWSDANGARFNHLTRYQVSIPLLERLTCLDFGALRTVDPLGWNIDRARLGESPVREIKSLDAIQLSSAERRRTRRYPRSGTAASCRCGAKGEERPSCSCSAAAPERPAMRDALQALAERIRLLEDHSIKEGARSASHREVIGRFDKIMGGALVRDALYDDCVCIGDDNDFFCTGVLVGPNVVVTAAHCLFDRDGRTNRLERVFIGNNLSDRDNQTEIISVVRQAAHPDYNPNGDDRSSSNDIAVLVLARDAIKGKPVKLITPAEVSEAEAVIVGFGTTNRNASAGFGVKRRASIPIGSLWRDNSDNHLATEAEVQGFDLHTEFTAESKLRDVDTCPGDSGGPAYIEDGGGAHRLLGLTSRGYLGSTYYCSEGGIYTLVAPFTDWVEATSVAFGGKTSWRDGAGTIVPPSDDQPDLEPPASDEFEPGCC